MQTILTDVILDCNGELGRCNVFYNIYTSEHINILLGNIAKINMNRYINELSPYEGEPKLQTILDIMRNTIIISKKLMYCDCITDRDSTLNIISSYINHIVLLKNACTSTNAS